MATPASSLQSNQSGFHLVKRLLCRRLSSVILQFSPETARSLVDINQIMEHKFCWIHDFFRHPLNGSKERKVKFADNFTIHAFVATLQLFHARCWFVEGRAWLANILLLAWILILKTRCLVFITLSFDPDLHQSWKLHSNMLKNREYSSVVSLASGVLVLGG